MSLNGRLHVNESGIPFAINGSRFIFHSITGGIMSLEEPDGTVIISANSANAGLIDIAYPLEEFGPFRLATPYSQVQKIEEKKGKVVIQYQSLGPSRKEFNYKGYVSAVITIEAHPDGRSVIFEAELVNHSDRTVPQILFPDFRGLVPVSGFKNTWFRQGGVKIRPFMELGKHAMNGVNNFWRGCWWEHFSPTGPRGSGGWWGGTALGRWSHYGSLKAGLGVFDEGWHPQHGHSVLLRIEEDAPVSGRMCFTREIPNWDQFTGNIQSKTGEGILPGETWKSARFVVTPHAGGWPRGITAYRECVQQHSCIELPKHVRDEIGFKSIYMAEMQESIPERCEYRWKDIKQLAHECKDAGISEICAWISMKPFQLPMQLQDILGTEKEFYEAMQICHNLNINFSLFISVVTLDPDTSKRLGGKGGTECGWSYHTEAIPGINPGYYSSFSGSVIDTSNEVWQEAVLSSVDDLIKKGAMSFAWDQYFVNPGRRTLDYVADEILYRTKAFNPSATFATESTGTFETESKIMHYTWNWREDSVKLFNSAHRMGDYASPAMSVWRAPRLNLNVEEDTAKIIKGFTDGFYLNFLMRRPNRIWGSARLNDYPKTYNLIKLLSSLRKQFLPYFIQGIVLGDGVMDDDRTDVHTSGYLLGNSLLLFVFNDRQNIRRDVKIGIKLRHWFKCEIFHGKLKVYNLSGKCFDNRPVKDASIIYSIDKLMPEELLILEFEL